MREEDQEMFADGKEKKYAVTEEMAIRQVAAALSASSLALLEEYENDYLGEESDLYNRELVPMMIDQMNGSSTVSLAAGGTVEDITQSVEYQTRYQQAINEYCQELAAAEIASGVMTADSSEETRAWRAACEESPSAVAYAEAVAEAFATGAAYGDTIGSEGPYGTRGSLGAALGSSVSMILSTYAQALLDYYIVNGALQELKDAIMKLPGAAFVAKIIAAIDCAMPPLFDPPLFDFLNTLEIDFCNNQYGIVLPRLVSLPIPNFKDFFKYLIEFAKEILLYILFRLLLYILTKIVLMLFDSLCKALQKLGEMASNALADAACQAMSNAGGFLGDVSDEMQSDEQDIDEIRYDEFGRPIEESGSAMCENPPRSLKDLIGEAFCGGSPDVTDEQLDATTNEVMRALGGVTETDAARMANSDSVNQLVADMSSVLTGDELADLLLGNPNPGAVAMVQEVVQTENPDFASALGSPGQIRDLMKSMGSMMPMEFRKKLRDDLSVPKGERPANPNLCTTQSDIKRFKDLRNMILQNKDGTTPAQATQQFDAFRGRALNDLEEAGDLLQGGVENFIANNMPPILGAPDPSSPTDPACPDSGIPPNAIIPRDPDELSDLMSSTNEKMYDIVGRAFQRDLTGRKGLLDMVLSDTCGIPHTRHDRKTTRSIHYSDYSGQVYGNFGMSAADAKDTFLEPLGKREKGEYPTYIAQYLRDYLTESRHLGPEGYVSTSDYTPNESIVYDETLPGITLPAGTFPVDSKGIAVGTEDNPIIIEGEKDPDLTLEFRDNNRGVPLDYLSADSQFAEGFNLEYSSYIINEDDDGIQSADTENVYRLKIVEVTNELATLPATPAEMFIENGPDFFGDAEVASEDEIIDIKVYGALTEAAEELRQQYDLTAVPTASPQNNLWGQYVLERFTSTGLTEEQQALFTTDTLFSSDNASQTYDAIVNRLLSYMGNNIASNESAYLFGYSAGEDEDLSPWDKVYMAPEGDKLFSEWVAEDLAPSLGSEYTRSNGKPRWRKLKKYIKENQIMGKSRHSRLEFLSPSEFGGSWMAPPFYITPPVSEGWLGIRDAILPEIDGKEPKRTSACNFEDIKERVDELTKKMPDDPRLSECPDCVVELPYSRILDRAAAGGMEGPILAVIRIYVVEEMLKAMPVFSNFKALIPEVMDHTYVEYIIAKMKIDFIENLGKQRGFLKGDALWYTFIEQCVQSYGRRIQLDGLEPPADVQSAINKINALQEDFKYPDEEDLTRAKMADGYNPWEKYGVSVEGLEPEIVFDRKVNRTTKLEWYRRWHLLQAVKDTEDSANIVLRALVEEQLEYMAEKFSEALEGINLKPEITNIHKYFIGSGNFVAGTDGFAPDLEDYAGTRQGHGCRGQY